MSHIQKYMCEFCSECDHEYLPDPDIKKLEKINAELLEALKEISKGEGVFSLDLQTHANNTIENMKEIAKAAIAKAE